MDMEKPLVDKDYQLEKLDCSAGWTFVEFPEIPTPKNTPFGMMKVKGSIDGCEFSKYSLMPSGKGTQFMPVKTAIRKKIKKEAGDYVHIILYPDNTPLEIPEELLSCFRDEDGVLEKFEAYTPGQKKAFVDWIYSARTEQGKADRIAKTIMMVQNGEKFY